MRRTPFLRLRYPWASDVVSAADIDSMAQDIDSALVQTATLASEFSRLSSVVVQRTAVQSITKATLTTITFDTVVLDNGTDSPLANGAWYNAAVPTRLTAPSPCVVLASALASINAGTALGTSGAVQTTVTLNGASSGANLQGTKWAPGSTDTGYQGASALTMWKLNTGDFLELKLFWTGTPAGPFNTGGAPTPPTLSLMMVALPTVP